MYFVGIAMVLCSAAFFGTLGPVERISMAAGVTPASVSVVTAVFPVHPFRIHEGKLRPLLFSFAPVPVKNFL
jgi:hypothetical protein